jgi:type II secretory pathway predicted ATPase ExeA
MYLSYFGLSRKPFSAVANPECIFSGTQFVETMETIRFSILADQGISLLTSQAGLGKSLMLQALTEELTPSHKPIYLATTGIPGRSSFLQAILFEMKRPYSHLGEQELRLSLIAAARDLQQTRLGVVLLLDELHLADNEIIDEVRCLTTYAEMGRPLFRVVTAGQLQLEDRLTDHRFDAFNQRVGSHVMIEPLSHVESLHYLKFQIEWAGGKIETIMTPEAQERISEVCAGVPRKLNQLSDQALVIAYAQSESLVGVDLINDIVREMYQWNTGLGSATTDSSFSEPAKKSTESVYGLMSESTTETAKGSGKMVSFEVGYGLEAPPRSVYETTTPQYNTMNDISFSGDESSDEDDFTEIGCTHNGQITQTGLSSVCSTAYTDTPEAYRLAEEELIQTLSTSLLSDESNPMMSEKTTFQCLPALIPGETQEFDITDKYSQIDYNRQFARANNGELPVVKKPITLPAKTLATVTTKTSTPSVETFESFETEDFMTKLNGELETQIVKTVRELQAEAQAMLQKSIAGLEVEEETNLSDIEYDVVMPEEDLHQVLQMIEPETTQTFETPAIQVMFQPVPVIAPVISPVVETVAELKKPETIKVPALKAPMIAPETLPMTEAISQDKRVDTGSDMASKRSFKFLFSKLRQRQQEDANQ